MSKSKIVCCVRGCGNTPKNISEASLQIKFYSFPCVSVYAPWKRKKREMWIDAIKRNTTCNRDWQPAKSTRICSAHFFGNEKSEHPLSPAYLPRIFPGNSQNLRRDQYQQTEPIPVATSRVSSIIVKDDGVRNIVHANTNFADVGHQTKDLQTEDDEDCDSYDSCIQIVRGNYCDVALQVFIKNKPDVSNKKLMKDASTSCSDLEDIPGVGSEEINFLKKKNIMNSLTGVSFETFDVLLDMLSSESS